jgi:hypothetical protein
MRTRRAPTFVRMGRSGEKAGRQVQRLLQRIAEYLDPDCFTKGEIIESYATFATDDPGAIIEEDIVKVLQIMEDRGLIKERRPDEYFFTASAYELLARI